MKILIKLIGLSIGFLLLLSACEQKEQIKAKSSSVDIREKQTIILDKEADEKPKKLEENAQPQIKVNKEDSSKETNDTDAKEQDMEGLNCKPLDHSKESTEEKEQYKKEQKKLKEEARRKAELERKKRWQK